MNEAGGTFAPAIVASTRYVPGPAWPAGAVAHRGALRPRSHSTVWVTVAPAGTLSRSGLPGRGQSSEAQTASACLSLIVRTALRGPKSALQAVFEVFLATRRKRGFSPVS